MNPELFLAFVVVAAAGSIVHLDTSVGESGENH